MRSEYKEWAAQYNESQPISFYDGAIAAWQHRQTEVDELQAKFDQHDQWLGQRNKDVQELNDIIKKQVAENDELQKRLEELTGGCELQRDHIKGLEAELKKAWTTVDQEAHKNHELVMLLKFVKEHFEMNDLDKAMPRVYEKLEQALKGGSTDDLNTDENGECRHFSTTMFHEGKAECFHCEAVVNEQREAIGKQSKGLHPFFKKEPK